MAHSEQTLCIPVLSSRDELEQLIEQLGGGESGKEEQSGSVTPAVSGSGASSDTEGM